MNTRTRPRPRRDSGGSVPLPEPVLTLMRRPNPGRPPERTGVFAAFTRIVDGEPAEPYVAIGNLDPCGALPAASRSSDLVNRGVRPDRTGLSMGFGSALATLYARLFRIEIGEETRWGPYRFLRTDPAEFAWLDGATLDHFDRLPGETS